MLGLATDGVPLHRSIELKDKPADVAMMLALMKVGRTKAGKFSVDNYIDAAGYIALSGELKERK